MATVMDIPNDGTPINLKEDRGKASLRRVLGSKQMMDMHNVLRKFKEYVPQEGLLLVLPYLDDLHEMRSVNWAAAIHQYLMDCRGSCAQSIIALPVIGRRTPMTKLQRLMVEEKKRRKKEERRREEEVEKMKRKEEAEEKRRKEEEAEEKKRMEEEEKKKRKEEKKRREEEERIIKRKRVAAGALAATWSRQSGLPRQYWRFVSRRGTVVSGGRVVGVDATCQAIVTAFPVFEGVCSGCPVRGGGGVLSYEKALTGSFFVWSENSMLELRFLEGLLRDPSQLVTRRPRRPRSCRDGATGRDMVATLLSVATDENMSRQPALSQLSWLVWDAEDNLEFYPAQASYHDEQSYGVSDRVYFPYRASCSFASALPFVAHPSVFPVSLPSSGRARVGRRRRGDACYSPSGSPWSVGGDRENRVLGVGRGLGSRVVTIGIRAWSDRTCSGSKLQQSWLRVGAVRLGSWLSSRMSPTCPLIGRFRRRCPWRSQWHSLRVHRAMYQGAWQPGQAAAGGQFPVPPPAVPEQQEVEPEVEQPVRQQRSGTGSTRSGQRRAAVSETRTALLERFLRLRPPMFHSEYDPDKAESWTHELERIFETMECAEEDQVRLAVYQLKGAAHEWWRVQRQTHFQGQRLDQISWQQFSEVFHGEYFPDYARRERRDQFHELVQGDLTVSQYHQRFVRLLRHVPHVAGSDQACAERFIAGLRPDLRWGVTAHMCTTLGEAVAKATALDREAWQPQQQQQGGASSRSSLSRSCLLAGVDGAASRGVSPGLQSSPYSRVLSRAVRSQCATLVACQATLGGIALGGKLCSSSSQCSTRSSHLSTSTLPSSRHRVSSREGSISSRSSSSRSRSSTSCTSSSISFLSTSSRRSSSPNRHRSVDVVVVA
ncbi:hypothetical protein Taro_045833 [Colocasia esculenta]|uniref:Retrotransposon gag domain-containing protein n=1 Tax=Colocasia esculenta TaxID=4460 RepID=A0A843X5D1_COLES|nr:hypothetical protein [Colocasia esculenta]